MTKILPIFLSVLIFFQGLSISITGISKVTTVISHLESYQEHFYETAVNLFDTHFGTDNILHKNGHEQNDEHENFPFKNKTQSNRNITKVFLINGFSIEFDNNNLFEITLNFFYKEMHSTFEKPNIFLPPRRT